MGLAVDEGGSCISLHDIKRLAVLLRSLLTVVRPLSQRRYHQSKSPSPARDVALRSFCAHGIDTSSLTSSRRTSHLPV